MTTFSTRTLEPFSARVTVLTLSWEYVFLLCAGRFSSFDLAGVCRQTPYGLPPAIGPCRFSTCLFVLWIPLFLIPLFSGDKRCWGPLIDRGILQVQGVSNLGTPHSVPCSVLQVNLSRCLLNQRYKSQDFQGITSLQVVSESASTAN